MSGKGNYTIKRVCNHKWLRLGAMGVIECQRCKLGLLDEEVETVLPHVSTLLLERELSKRIGVLRS